VGFWNANWNVQIHTNAIAGV